MSLPWGWCYSWHGRSILPLISGGCTACHGMSIGGKAAKVLAATGLDVITEHDLKGIRAECDRHVQRKLYESLDELAAPVGRAGSQERSHYECGIHAAMESESQDVATAVLGGILPPSRNDVLALRPRGRPEAARSRSTPEGERR